MNMLPSLGIDLAVPVPCCLLRSAAAELRSLAADCGSELILPEADVPNAELMMASSLHRPIQQITHMAVVMSASTLISSVGVGV